ncbi:hypothetical protein [Paraburkholderia sp. 2C]|jgi:hypothetical protein
MSELKTERIILTSEAYVQCVRSLLVEVSGWCAARDLTIQDGVVKLREEGIPEYEAPSLYISKDGMSKAKIVPRGLNILGAHGRVDLSGRVKRQPLLYRIGKGPVSSAQSGTEGRAGASSPRWLSDVERDGWYWMEGNILRPKLVDESLFVDLLTYVLNHDL